MKPNTGITEKNAEGVVSILNTLLADEYILYTKTRNYHWNVTGSSFQELHKFFESQYNELDEIIDEVAERIRSLGAFSPGAMKTFLETSRLSEEKDFGLKSTEMLDALLKDHEAIIRSLRSDLVAVADKYSDIGTSDFLTGLMEQHEKMAWMLRAYLS